MRVKNIVEIRRWAKTNSEARNDINPLGRTVLIPESGVKATSSGLERLQAVDLAEYVVDEVA